MQLKRLNDRRKKPSRVTNSRVAHDIRFVCVFVLTLPLIGTWPAGAAYREGCRAKYQTSLGWSQIYHVECLYSTGLELNQATGSLAYEGLKTYAIVFWAPNQATVVKIEEFVFCGIEAKSNCANHVFGYINGPDQEGRRWRICQPPAIVC
jgi:hypothetical protein